MCRTKKRVYTLKAFVPETGEYINEEFNRVIDMCNKYGELLNLTVRRTDGIRAQTKHACKHYKHIRIFEQIILEKPKSISSAASDLSTINTV
jgi:hypothetical protein